MAEPNQDYYASLNQMYGQANPALDPQLAQLREKATQDLLRSYQEPEPQTQFQPYQPTSKDQEMAEQLRNRGKMAQIMAMSGDAPLTKAAGFVAPEQSAEQFLRQQGKDQQVRQYQEAQLNRPGKREERLRKTIEMINKQDPRASAPKMSITSGEKTQWQQRKGLMQNVERYIGALDNGVALTQETADLVKKELGIDIDGSLKSLEGLGDILATRGANLPPEVLNQLQFWADLEANLIAPWRNETFGATLTTNEQAAFERMSRLHPTMDPKEVRKRLANIMSNLVAEGRNIVETNVMEFGPQAIPTFQAYFGDYLNQDMGRTWERMAQDAEDMPGPGTAAVPETDPETGQTRYKRRTERGDEMVFEVVE